MSAACGPSRTSSFPNEKIAVFCRIDANEQGAVVTAQIDAAGPATLNGGDRIEARRAEGTAVPLKSFLNEIRILDGHRFDDFHYEAAIPGTGALAVGWGREDVATTWQEVEIPPMPAIAYATSPEPAIQWTAYEPPKTDKDSVMFAQPMVDFRAACVDQASVPIAKASRKDDGWAPLSALFGESTEAYASCKKIRVIATRSAKTRMNGLGLEHNRSWCDVTISGAVDFDRSAP